jgi:ssDNA thymidine ADP-ribosyltransferase, DarT
VAITVPIPTRICHVTHWKNLPAILAEGGLLCCATLRKRKTSYHDVANPEIQDRRAICKVPVEPFGKVHDYVPFFFAPRSPMLYLISRGGSRYPEGQTPMIHLATTAQIVFDNRPCVFTNGHAIMSLSDYFTDLDSLDQIDWDLMRETYWNDTQDDPDRKRRRQAEFLVHRHCPWELIAEIGVFNRTIQAKVIEIVETVEHQPPVKIRRGWFY